MTIKSMLPTIIAVVVGLLAYNMVIKKVLPGGADSFEMDEY